MIENTVSKSLDGIGLGLRAPHYQKILSSSPVVGWYEVLVDNYMGDGGLPLHYLQKVAEQHALSFHGVGMSLGSTDPLNLEYLHKLKQLTERFQPEHVSDHVCWNSANGVHGHDLFPMPYTEEAVRHLAERIQQVQEILGRRILIENVSTYLGYQESCMTEAEFIRELVQRADCYLLCDLNNIYVSAINQRFSAEAYLDAMPADRIREFHLAGYEDMGTHLLDTHGSQVHGPVWDLYQRALERFGRIPTLIEWDTDIPEFDVLLQERDKAQGYWDAAQYVAA